MREAFLFVHPTLGVLGMLAALWVFVEAFKIDEVGLRRIRLMSLVGAGLFLLTWFSGGLWDAFFYDADRAVIQKGSWAFVGYTAMELKEHLFVVVLLLALYLPIVAFATDARRDSPIYRRWTHSAVDICWRISLRSWVPSTSYSARSIVHRSGLRRISELCFLDPVHQRLPFMQVCDE